MSSSLDCLDLCRLCLIKDRVSVPIFEDEGDVRQIFLKITACLPVKVSRDDKLPKKICDDCVYKVELFYQFWNTTANAEKQLLQWLGEVDLEDKQTYVTEVLDTNVMKQEQNSDNRLEGNVIQVSGHQNNMDIGMIEDMTIMTIPAGSEQQFTTVPMDTSGTVQTVQAVPGPSTHDQMGQSQTHLVTEEVEESEEEENSDDGCDNEEGLPVKEETEEVQTETFVNVPISCDEAGPSGLQQQKVTEMSEMSMTQTATDGDPKTGHKRKYQPRTRRVIDDEGNIYDAIVPTTSIIPDQQNETTTDDFEEVTIDGVSSSDVKDELIDDSSPVYMCNPCQIYFPLQTMLERHIDTVHPEVIIHSKPVNSNHFQDNFKDLYACKYCTFQSSIKSLLMVHASNCHDLLIKKITSRTPSVTVAIEGTSKFKHNEKEYFEEIDEKLGLIPGDMEMITPDEIIQKDEIVNNLETQTDDEEEINKNMIEEEHIVEQQHLIDEDHIFEPQHLVDNEYIVEQEHFIDEETADEQHHLMEEHMVEQQDLIEEEPIFEEESMISVESMFEIQPIMEPITEEEEEQHSMIQEHMFETEFTVEEQTIKREQKNKRRKTNKNTNVDKNTDELDEEEAGKLFTCPYCEFESTKKTNIYAHINNDHNDEWHNKTAREATNLWLSKKNLNDVKTKRKSTVKLLPDGRKERKWKCEHCSYAATTRATLLSHTRGKHPGLTQSLLEKRNRYVELRCDECDFSTDDKRKMQMHIERKHVTESRYACEYCAKKFKVKCDLTSHIRMQHFKTPSICHVCGHISKNTNALHIHQKREHFIPEFECKICHRRMVSQENLDEHVYRQHTNRTKFVCEQCGKVFNQAGKLRQHLMTHTGEKPHSCPMCGKCFARRSVLRQHVLTHTGEKPYVCDICGKGFTQKPGLICHRKMHPGEKPPLPVVFIDHILNKYIDPGE